MPLTRGYQQLLDEALAQVTTLGVDEARALHGRDDVVFVDVRDVRELEAEGVVPGVVAEPWFGIITPAGTPVPVIARLNDAFNKALQVPRIRKRLEEAAVRVLGGTPQRMAQQVRADLDRWGKVVKANGIRAE